MLDAEQLAVRFREGDRRFCDGAYRSRATTQAWVVACARRDPIRMLDVQAALFAVPGGSAAARKFRILCAEAARIDARAGAYGAEHRRTAIDTTARLDQSG